MTAAVLTFPKGIAIVMATNWMPSRYVAVTAQLMPTVMAFVTMRTTASEHWILAVFATVLVPFMTAVVAVSQREIVTVTAASSMH